MQRLERQIHEQEALLGKKRPIEEEPETSVAAEASLLSPELLAELGEDAIIVSKRKKPKQTKKEVELTPQERKQAQKLYKSASKKLEQLQQRQQQKEKRQELYDKLQQNAFTQSHLLHSSSTLGKQVSKREQLHNILQKERAGLTLTEAEHDLLYRDRKSTRLNSSHT